MPSLSFMKAPKWKSIVSNRTPFPPSRFDSLNASSSHPYASPDILEINDATSSLRSTPEPPPKSPSPRYPTPPAPPAAPTHPAATSTSLAAPVPTVQIELDLPTVPFDSDWFQNRFAESLQTPRQNDKRRISHNAAVGRNRTVGDAAALPAAANDGLAVIDDDEDLDISSSEDAVLNDLKAMDGSTILGISSPSNKMAEPPSSSLTKKTPPAPIKIPSFQMHGPQVQIIRSGEAKSRPLSEVSSIESSAVSGQTIARALLGNSFILSTDARSSRYRSGFGGLVRSDSATLPRGDHPYSPYYHKDRPASGSGNTFAVSYDAPPIPANADKVYVPPRAQRASSPESKKKPSVRRPSSTSSLASLKEESGDVKSRPSSFSDFSHEEKMDMQASRRISRISEAPSTSPTGAPNMESTPPITSSERSPVGPSAPIAGTSNTVPSESSNHSPSASWNYKPPAPPPVTSSSPKDLDVVEFYASDMQRTYAPVFTPITEETPSQLSTPGSRRLSQRGTATTQAFSPLSSTLNGRLDLSSVRRPSDGSVVNRNSSSNRRSVQAPLDPNSLLPPANPDSHVNGGGISGRRVSQAQPVVGRVVGGRSRAGSTPGPIKITRDSRDYNTYKIVSPYPENPSETPLPEDSDFEAQQVQQTFPETPNAFSPYWTSRTNSPAIVSGPSEGQQVHPLSQMQTFTTSHTTGPHGISDQEILTRAATMVQARHSRQPSVAKRVLPQPQGPAATSDSNHGDVTGEDGPVQVVQAPSSRPTETSPVSSASQYSASNEDSRRSYEEPNTGFAIIEATLASPWSRSSSPTLGHTVRDNTSHSTTPVATFARSQSPLSYNTGSSAHDLSTSSLHTHTNSPPLGQRTPSVPSLRNHYVQPSPPVVITPPAGEVTASSSPYIGRSLRRISETSHNTFDSPPPYDTIDHNRPPSIVASSSNSTEEQHQFIGRGPQNSPPAHLDSSNEGSPLIRKTSTRDRRVRPRPGGPRRPVSNLLGPGRNKSVTGSSVASSAPLNAVATSMRTPAGTPLLEPRVVSNDLLEPGPSLSGTTMMNNNNIISLSPVTPNFLVPPAPYRGLTMDQAKWTFTSAQLQAIVSRAIRQSAEATSIRLLRLDTLDNEIPQDLERLETQRLEIKSRYQTLTRTSKVLFAKLSNGVGGSSSQRAVVDELKDTVQQLSALTEQLHVVDQQHAEIQKLVEVHSASALSMALRKLNASFLQQLTQNQELQRRVEDLEEEIWSLRDLRTSKPSLDGLPQVFPSQGPGVSLRQTVYHQSPANETSTGSSPESEKKRVVGASVSRNASARSKSNRLSGRLSHRSSWSSFGTRGSMVGGGPATSSGFSGVPPVPPLPRRRPTEIFTGLSTQRTTMISTDGGTPSTDVRAMIRAQEELYQSLGSSLRSSFRIRRSHSIIGLPGTPDLPAHPSATGGANNSVLSPRGRMSRFEREMSPSPNRTSSRPLSYPASLLDAYNHLDADRNAMLATLELMSRDDDY